MTGVNGTVWRRFRPVPGLLVACGALGWAPSAHADCYAPPLLLWTYPDEATGVVPTSSHLWVLGTSRLSYALTVTLDGERIQRVNATGSEPLVRAEYAPNEPLAPGEHELVIELRTSSDAEPLETRRISFVAEGSSVQEARAEVSSVTRYEWIGTDSRLRAPEPFPPEAAYDGDCTERVVDTSEGCNDTYWSGSVGTRVELTSNGESIANLVGDLLVPGDCRVFFPWGPAANAEDYPLTQVMPEGVLSPRSFEGEVEVIEGGSPVEYQQPPGWCSLARVRSTSLSTTALLGVLGLGAVVVSRRRTRG